MTSGVLNDKGFLEHPDKIAANKRTIHTNISTLMVQIDSQIFNGFPIVLTGSDKEFFLRNFVLKARHMALCELDLIVTESHKIDAIEKALDSITPEEMKKAKDQHLNCTGKELSLKDLRRKSLFDAEKLNYVYFGSDSSCDFKTIRDDWIDGCESLIAKMNWQVKLNEHFKLGRFPVTRNIGHLNAFLFSYQMLRNAHVHVMKFTSSASKIPKSMQDK